MSLQPLLAESIVVQLHAFAAPAAFVVGLSQFILPKGTLRHRIVGYGWLAFMLIVALTSFGIHQIRQFGPWSLIHLLSIYTLALLPLAVLQARRQAMIGLFVGGLVLAGLLTLTLRRVINEVAFGSVS